MAEYTPTTEEIREYVETGGEPRPWVELDDAEKAREKARGEAFDRWLAAHEAEVREHARHEFCHPRLGCLVAEEPEWEYGCGVPGGTHCWAAPSEVEAEKNRLAGEVVMKRTAAIPAGPWVPVKQESPCCAACDQFGDDHAGEGCGNQDCWCHSARSRP